VSDKATETIAPDIGPLPRHAAGGSVWQPGVFVQRPRTRNPLAEARWAAAWRQTGPPAALAATVE